MTTTWFVVPEGFDDPRRVSGGNVYDLELLRGLEALGRTVLTAVVSNEATTAEALGRVASGDLVLVDGLVAGWAPGAIEETAARARLVILAHMVRSALPGSPDTAAEQRAFAAAATVIATSNWTATELAGQVDRIAVAHPGSRAVADDSRGDHRSLLCVAAIAPHKGQDVLLAALALLPTDDWSCTLVGSADVAPAFAEKVTNEAAGLASRMRLPGILLGEELELEYRRAGLLVAPSRAESFGMAIADARSRGIPVIASDVGGIPEAVAPEGSVLVPPDEPRALADALANWLGDEGFRARLIAGAERGRAGTQRWADTARQVDRVLESV